MIWRKYLSNKRSKERVVRYTQVASFLYSSNVFYIYYISMKLIDKLRLKFIKYKYNKLIDKQYKRIKEQEKMKRDYLIEEIDRRLERTDEIVSNINKVFNS